MKIDEYKTIRETGKDLTSKIFKFAIINNEEIIYAANLLGFWNGRALVYGSNEDFDIITDFLIFEKLKHSIAVFKKFHDSNPELNDLEQENMKGILRNYSSLFQITSIDSKSSTLVLLDLLSPDRQEYKLMDVGISQSTSVGSIFYSRLLPIGDVYMTSGVSFGFDRSYKDKLFTAISLATIKRKKKLTSTELFLLFHKKSQQYGIKIKIM